MSDSDDFPHGFDPSWWSSKTVLVAGAGGLIGAALMRLLDGRTRHLKGWRRRNGDLRNPGIAREAISGGAYDVIFLMAATQGGIIDHLARPVAYLRDNAEIGLSVIGAAGEAGVPHLVYAASGALYPADAGEALSEDRIASGPIDPAHRPYAAAKLMGVRLCEAYAAERGFAYAPAIINNTYGPGGSFDPSRSTLIHGMIARAEQARAAGGRRLVVWGTGKAHRDVLYGDDAARALILVAQSAKAAPVNVASGVNRSVREIAEVIAAAAGLDGLEFDPTKPEGALSRPVEISRLSALGFAPSVTLADGIARTRAAYRALDGAR